MRVLYMTAGGNENDIIDVNRNSSVYGNVVVPSYFFSEKKKPSPSCGGFLSALFHLFMGICCFEFRDSVTS